MAKKKIVYIYTKKVIIFVYWLKKKYIYNALNQFSISQ